MPGQIQCGSELARDSYLTVDIDGDWQGLIASKLAPTVDSEWFQDWPGYFSSKSFSRKE
jgi:hypothetical protein